MSQATLEQRVATLEQQVAQLLTAPHAKDVQKDWRKTVGMFSGDEVMKAIQEEAQKFREVDREQANRDHP